MKGIHFSLDNLYFQAVLDEHQISIWPWLALLIKELLESVQSACSIKTGRIPLSRFSSFEIEKLLWTSKSHSDAPNHTETTGEKQTQTPTWLTISWTCFLHSVVKMRCVHVHWSKQGIRITRLPQLSPVESRLLGQIRTICMNCSDVLLYSIYFHPKSDENWTNKNEPQEVKISWKCDHFYSYV